MKKENEIIEVVGEKGGSSRTPVEAPNTLQSRAVVRLLDLISEGEIEGLVDQANSIFFDNTPIEGNFQGVGWAERRGIADQSPIDGFNNVEAEFDVSTEVTNATSVTRTVSSTDVDAMRVTIRLPQGLLDQNKENGDLNGYNVTIAIDRRIAAGVWSNVTTPTISGKTTSPYETDFRISRPNTGADGLWQVRVRRISADDSDTSKRSRTDWQRYTEITEHVDGYDNSAIVGLEIPAESTGGVLANRSFEVQGIKIKVPTNYAPATGTYTGLWDGTFKTEYSNNPAWVLYDILTNTRYGMGEFISEDIVDKFSFYDAGVYCDGEVTDGIGSPTTGLERRFTFNGVIQSRGDPLKLIQSVAATMRSYVCTVGGMVKVIQDRPKTALSLVTNASVVDGVFNYSSSDINQRHTEVRVTFNDPEQNYLPRTIVETDATAIARYGSVPMDVALLGCTSEGQARRHAKWVLDTEYNSIDLASWQASWETLNYSVGDVVKVVDNDYMDLQAGGRLEANSTTTQIQLDRDVTIEGGKSYTLAILMDDGNIEERTVISGAGTYSAVTTLAFSSAPTDFHQWYIYADVEAREFQILSVRESDTLGLWEVSAIQHDPTKFARVETGLNVPTPTYSAIDGATQLGAVSNVRVSEGSWTDPTGFQPNRYFLRAEWNKPTTNGQYTDYYRVKWRRQDGSWTVTEKVEELAYEIDGVWPGVYQIIVYPFDIYGVQGPGQQVNYQVTGGLSDPLGSPIAPSNLFPVLDLYVAGGGSPRTETFTTKDLNIEWETNPLNVEYTVGSPEVVLHNIDGYHIKIYDSTGLTLLRDDFIHKKDGNTYTYTFSSNDSTLSGPHRTMQVEVTVIDTLGRESTSVTEVFTNPAPATASFDNIVSGTEQVFIDIAETSETDIAGYYVWRSTSNGFTPGPSNQIYKGPDRSISVSAAENTTYYYRCAAYDLFDDDYTTLNISSQSSDTTLSANIIDTYTFDGLTFEPNDPSTNSVSWTVGNAHVDDGTTTTTYAISAGNAAWTTGILYIYYVKGEGILRSTTSIGTAMGTNQRVLATYKGGTELIVGNGAPIIDGDKILAGTIGANQLVTGSAVITQTAQIQNSIITTAKIDDAQITTAKIDDAAITSAKIDDAAIVNAKIDDAAITTLKLVNGSVSQLDFQKLSGFNTYTNGTGWDTVPPTYTFTMPNVGSTPIPTLVTVNYYFWVVSNQLGTTTAATEYSFLQAAPLVVNGSTIFTQRYILNDTNEWSGGPICLSFIQSFTPGSTVTVRYSSAAPLPNATFNGQYYFDTMSFGSWVYTSTVLLR